MHGFRAGSPCTRIRLFRRFAIVYANPQHLGTILGKELLGDGESRPVPLRPDQGG
jgi:hypothetical protein